jgi:hypothetical protein
LKAGIMWNRFRKLHKIWAPGWKMGHDSHSRCLGRVSSNYV